MNQPNLFPEFPNFRVTDTVTGGICSKLIAPAQYKRVYVMLHGNGGTMASWSYVISTLQARDHEESAFLLVDLPNHGRSARSYTRNARPNQRVLLEKIQHAVQDALVTPGAQVVLVGHCLGGMIAQLLAYTFPTYYTHLVLINTGSTIPAFLLLITHPPFPWLIKIVETYWPASWYKDADFLMPKKRYMHDIDIRRMWQDIQTVGAKYYFQIGLFIHTISFEPFIKTLTLPTLVIGGEEDTYYQKNTTISFAKMFQCATLLLIKKAGHMAIFTNPDEVAEAIHSHTHL